MNKTRNYYRLLFYFKVALCSYIILIYHFKIIPGTSSCWDFKIYYYAPKILFSGSNPYDNPAAQQFGVESSLPYRYHPVTIYLFSFFNNWEHQQAKHIYNYIRIIILFAAVFIWLKYLTESYRLKFLLVLVTTFGFGALMLDIQAGNIAIFEMFLLTLAVIFFLKSKTALYFAIIIFLSLFRVQNMLFLLVPMIYFNRKNLYLFILSVLFLLSLNLVWYFAVNPEIEKAYLAQILSAFDEQGMDSANIGVLLFIKTFILPGPSYLVYLVYFGWIVILTVPSVYVILKIKDKVSRLVILTFIAFLYVFITPRILEYQYVILIVPSIFVLNYTITNTKLVFAVVALICINLIDHYQPLVVAFTLFAVYFYHLYNVSKSKAELNKSYLSNTLVEASG